MAKKSSCEGHLVLTLKWWSQMLPEGIVQCMYHIPHLMGAIWAIPDPSTSPMHYTKHLSVVFPQSVDLVENGINFSP